MANHESSSSTTKLDWQQKFETALLEVDQQNLAEAAIYCEEKGPVMATADRQLARPWREIAAELSEATDSKKTLRLTQDLIEALEASEKSMAALVRGPKPQEISKQQKLPKRLLFVDDEASIRATLPVILEQHGFQVKVAANIPEALEQIQNHKFDVLLSDLNISEPGDGFRVVHAIRQINCDCVAIILTGYPGFDSAVTGIHEKIDDYLVKPAEIELLIASLEKKLSERSKDGSANVPAE